MPGWLIGLIALIIVGGFIRAATWMVAHAPRSYRAEGEQALPVQDETRVLVRTRAGSLIVEAADAEKVTVQAHQQIQAASGEAAAAFAKEVALLTESRGGQLIILAAWPEHLPPEVHSVAVHLTLRVPRRWGVEAAAAQGAVTVSGVAGAVSVQNRNGPVSVRDVGGAVQAESANGAVTILGCDGKVNARTNNGPLRITDARSAVTAQTSNGDLEVEFAASGPLRADLSASNGNLLLALPPDADALLLGRTRNGRIELPEPWEAEINEDQTQVKATLGEGAGHVTLQASNGRICVKRKA